MTEKWITISNKKKLTKHVLPVDEISLYALKKKIIL